MISITNILLQDFHVGFASNIVNLAKTLGAQCIAAKNIEILLNATVTQIQLNSQKTSVQNLIVSSAPGHQVLVQAKQYVICAGTLETTRLLLASDKQFSQGVGNEYDLVGRYFQDHLSYRAAKLYPTNHKLFRRLFAPFFSRKIMFTPRLHLHSEQQEKLQCLSAFGHILFEADDQSCFAAMRDILRRRQQENKLTIQRNEIVNILKSIPYFLSLSRCFWLGGKVPFPPGSHWYLQVEC